MEAHFARSSGYLNIYPKQDLLNNLRAKFFYSGRGGGLVDSLLAFWSDDLSSNPADNQNFWFEKT